MTQLSLFAPDWMTARDLDQQDLPGLPKHRPNIASFISRIAAHSPDLVRPRKGKGGGYEVSVLALPQAAQDELKRRSAARNLSTTEAQDNSGQDLADAIDTDKRQIASRVIGHLTERQRRVMQARQAVLLMIEAQALTSGCGKERAIRTLIDTASRGALDPAQSELVRIANDRSTDATLSDRTVYRWFQAREAGGIVELAPKASREPDQLPAWFDGFLKFYSSPAKPSIAEALRSFTATQASAPIITEKQVRRCLAKMPQLERMKGREGKLAMRTRLAYTARDVSDLLPTSVYVADGKTFDAEVAHPIHGQPFRPELTTIIDASTRKVVGWSAALDENTFAVVDALRRASASHGVPAIFYTDRGPGYKNKAMDAPLTGFMARAGITPMRALPYNSQAKGVVERLNQIYTAAAKSLPTYMGRDMDKEAKLIAFKTTRRDLAVTGTSRLMIGWDAFLDHIEATLSAYNDRPHSSLPKVRDSQIRRVRHMTPAEVWQAKSAGFEAVIPDAAELDDMFRPYVVRRTRRGLVEWLGNSYFAVDLDLLDGQDVAVGYDIRDASKVWVRTIELVDDERVPGRLVAIAAFEGHKTRYVPYSAEQKAIETRNKGRKGRLLKKLDVVEQELRPSTIIDMMIRKATHPAIAAPASTQPASTQPASPEIAPNLSAAYGTTPASLEGATPLRAGERPICHDDVSLARWLAANPDRATASDIELLRELLTSHSTNELLRMSGVDLERLRSIARSTPILERDCIRSTQQG